MFQKLVAAHTVTSAILDAVHSFGAKVTGEDDPLFNICHYSPFIRDPEDQVVHGGRFSGELISQFAMTIAQHKSRVLLYHTVFRKAWQNGAQTSMVTKTNILISQIRSGHSENGLDNKVAAYTVNGKTEKASYSSVSFREGDYDTDFSDAQRLQTLCDKMTLVTSILDADMDIAQAIKSQCRDLRRLKHPDLPDEASTLTNVNLDIQRLKGFKRQAVALRAQARGTSQLASRSPALAHRSHLLIQILQLIQLLSYRRADTLNAHAKALRGLTATSTAQSASLRDLTEKTRMDSRCMRILTFIALLYLPANLIAVRGEPNP
ncbi:MAG: hypothetical protein Q9161_003447 [Pseudevernia consocians]